MNQDNISIEGLFLVNENTYEAMLLYISPYEESVKSYVEKSGRNIYYFYNTPMKYISLYLNGVILAKYLYENKDIENFNEMFIEELNEIKQIKKELYIFRNHRIHIKQPAEIINDIIPSNQK